ncbi:MAG TPA: hypothetical protein PLX89_13125 [Verrucomicrobiota bacterium]|nr:hypothetical protein [Verrucomicrobiota bacterium]
MTAELAGTWVTEKSARTELRVVEVDALLAMPAAIVELPDSDAAIAFDRKVFMLTLAESELTFPGAEAIVGKRNAGILDPRARAFDVTLCLRMTSSALIIPAIIRSTGTVGRTGEIESTGMGRAFWEPLGGIQLMCGCPSKPRVPKPKCGIRDTTVLYDGTTCQLMCVNSPHGGASAPAGSHVDAAGHMW